MQIDAITRRKLKDVVFKATEPTSTNVIWAKPNGDEVTMYIFKNGAWISLKSEGLEPVVQAYIDAQDIATLDTAKEYADKSITTAKEFLQDNIDTNSTDITTLKGYFNDGVANKATQLSTTTTLWGNDFNGTASVSGDLMNIGTVGKSNARLCIEGVAADTDYSHIYVAQNHLPLVLQYNYGNVGVGVMNPTVKLQVEGTFKASGDTPIGGNTTIDKNLTINGSITATSSPWVTTTYVEEALSKKQDACKVWANVLSTTDTYIAVDGKPVKLSAHKNVVIKDFSSVKAYGSYSTANIQRFDMHYNEIVPMDFRLGSIENIRQFDASGMDTSNMTNMEQMFAYSQCSYLDVSGFNTSKVTDMGRMFHGTTKLNYLDVSGFDMSKVTSCFAMFALAYELKTLDVSNWDMNKASNLFGMFYKCYSLSELDVSKWDTSEITDLSDMFYECNSLTDITFGEGWGKNHLTLDLSTCGTGQSYKLTDNTYNSMLNMYDRASNGLTTTFTIKFSSKHNIPDGWVDKMTAKGYTIVIR